ncbi:hypothetical protein B0H15DRAFT_780400 [Mycena belliarum]|uniref:Uncharacterized protein n=1 Tax=Mycena belliarum TaxID=1033014 RepID=A0AAD6XP84_9AGAR|nr:hypothetical protein B0H15DRAFT_780400 [Mycena belliae]
MGQLRPVQAHSLFAHDLVDHISAGTRETCTGIDALYGAWIWREFKKVVILRKNFRARSDPQYTNLLARIRMGSAWDGRTRMTETQAGTGPNFTSSDYDTIRQRQLQGMSPTDQAPFADAPIVCGTKVVRDLLNRELTQDYANKAGKAMHDYYALDTFNALPLNEELQKRTWQLRSALTKDSLGRLPLAIGMKVMVMDNIALSAAMVNGAKGILRGVKYSTDNKGRRYVDCAYVEIPRSGVNMTGLAANVVPIVPQKTYIKYKAEDGSLFSLGRTQIGLLPAYAYIDYKSQGRSLQKVILDLNGCRSLQSVYVMLSRATSLKTVAVLRSFRPRVLISRLGQEFRNEFERLERLDASTKAEWEAQRTLSDAAFDAY